MRRVPHQVCVSTNLSFDHPLVSISSPTFEPAADNSASQGEVIEPDDKLKEYLRMLRKLFNLRSGLTTL